MGVHPALPLAAALAAAASLPLCRGARNAERSAELGSLQVDDIESRLNYGRLEEKGMFACKISAKSGESFTEVTKSCMKCSQRKFQLLSDIMPAAFDVCQEPAACHCMPKAAGVLGFRFKPRRSETCSSKSCWGIYEFHYRLGDTSQWEAECNACTDEACFQGYVLRSLPKTARVEPDQPGEPAGSCGLDAAGSKRPEAKPTVAREVAEVPKPATVRGGWPPAGEVKRTPPAQPTTTTAAVTTTVPKATPAAPPGGGAAVPAARTDGLHPRGRPPARRVRDWLTTTTIIREAEAEAKLSVRERVQRWPKVQTVRRGSPQPPATTTIREAEAKPTIAQRAADAPKPAAVMRGQPPARTWKRNPPTQPTTTTTAAVMAAVSKVKPVARPAAINLVREARSLVAGSALPSMAVWAISMA